MYATGADDDLAIGLYDVFFASVYEPDALGYPVSVFLFQQHLSHSRLGKQDQVLSRGDRFIISVGGITPFPPLGVDATERGPHADVRAGEVASVRRDAELVEGFVPVSVGSAVLERIRGLERPRSAVEGWIVVGSMLALVRGG